VLAVPVSEDWGITSSLTPDCPCPVYRFLPHKVKGEGLFMAVMRKPDSNETISSSRKKKSKRNAKELPIPKACKEWLAEGQAFFWEWHNGIVVALPQLMREVWDVLSEQLHVLQAGIPVAAMKGRDLIPEHALALSEARNRQTFPEVELEYAQAIAYLRKEAVALPCDTPKGFVCVTYRGVALGWVKHLGNRANNLYPDPWRIRSGHLPEEIILLKDLIITT
ncbi:MAG: rRNA cytosine-C5-methyltransferase, partial [Bacteroidaceae bacterium]|nr:rRNA cytosine-C5-methyltransferase [Bacteroidaceae bacterium]